VEFKSELGDWPDVRFALTIPSGLTEEERAYLTDLLMSWYVVGSHGGFGPADFPNGSGRFHFMTEPTFEDGAEGDLVVTWRVDAGTAPQRVLDALGAHARRVVIEPRPVNTGDGVMLATRVENDPLRVHCGTLAHPRVTLLHRNVIPIRELRSPKIRHPWTTSDSTSDAFAAGLCDGRRRRSSLLIPRCEFVSDRCCPCVDLVPVAPVAFPAVGHPYR
jgi:hypothetical protein